MEAHEAKQVAFVLGNVAAGLIEAMGMLADNQDRLSKGETIAFDYMSFQETIEKYGLGHNSLIKNLYHT